MQKLDIHETAGLVRYAIRAAWSSPRLPLLGLLHGGCPTGSVFPVSSFRRAPDVAYFTVCYSPTVQQPGRVLHQVPPNTTTVCKTSCLM